jgi:ribosomal silencing factor RsfS
MTYILQNQTGIVNNQDEKEAQDALIYDMSELFNQLKWKLRLYESMIISDERPEEKGSAILEKIQDQLQVILGIRV